MHSLLKRMKKFFSGKFKIAIFREITFSRGNYRFGIIIECGT
ncbi:hypothetical protein GGD38_006945 [Chitinophagaceae bacterium OAS944]|nr:hypothetical protein [Chitinophagaceae bacterium OAS944]